MEDTHIEKIGKCDKGHNGDCCCNCINQIKIHRHCTFDKTKQDKGCICNKPFIYNGKEAYLCNMRFEDGSSQASIMNKHGMCEMHYPKNYKINNNEKI